MSSIFTLFFFFLFLKIATCGVQNNNFNLNGFGGAKLDLDGIASITPEGLLRLTNATRMKAGHAFHPVPLRFKSPAGETLSFSTTFVFAIVSKYSDVSSHGMAFLVSPTVNLSTALPSQYLGLFNSENCSAANHVLAVELDTIENQEFADINDNHVGIDVNCLKSVYSRPAGYYSGRATDDQFESLNLHSGEPMQVWVDFAGGDMQFNVTMSPAQMPKPSRPLLSATVNLSSVVYDQMYVGFSATTGSSNQPSHYVLGWSFMVNGEAESLDYRKLPQLPRLPRSKQKPKHIVVWLLPLAIFTFALMVAATVILVVRRRIKYAEVLEDWEKEYGPHRFSYKDLYCATDGFKDNGLLGVGGFGRVYRGVLRASNIEVAVKRVSHKSGQGMKEFVAEIVSIGKLRHRNVAHLLGYCRRKGELLLVYDYMPNGSLDKYLYDQTRPSLNWAQRFMIIKGVASAILYLHEEWEQVVVHRDIKASNVLLDGELNAKLGDFGLARLCKHGTDPRTTRIIGTIGYLAPEFTRKGKATTMSDIFSFGAFLLEVACGRRPLVVEAGEEEQVFLVDWVLENWKARTVLATRDQRLGLEEERSAMEMEMVLKLGCLCSHPMPEARPSMRRVMQFLDGDKTLPDLSLAYMSFSYPSLMQNQGYDGGDCIVSIPISVATVSTSSLNAR
ncbi:L-type lectin-domain containing receptor kinase IV.2-like [Iris pallida]|uniref:non-specific serine/threonine protein kinase n=1 Tax=Iris pallida TaxID=29817 RepID=A0AAX6GXC0_IRIPA|nr:L-type lectin-domain containing receptor kinase IV.2-like [Iris pallida]